MTFPGQFLGIALSPDATRIAFTWNGPDSGKWNIYVQRIGGDRPLQITDTQGGMIPYVDWFPDGRLLVFGRCGDDNRESLYTIPALGGPKHKVTDVACDWAAAGAIWGPGGQSLLFPNSCSDGGFMGSYWTNEITRGMSARASALVASQNRQLIQIAAKPEFPRNCRNA
jgi:Tol biopolymer transport system component